MKIQDVLSCSFPNWYKDFEDITAKSIVIALPEGFISYLLKDGIILPKSGEAAEYSNLSNAVDSDDDSDWDDSDSVGPEAPNFPEFEEQIQAAITQLGGKVFPKLNWSSPRDASWIALNNTCCCCTVIDIFLLLKSSDFIMHDLTVAYSSCEDRVSTIADTPTEGLVLVLREWTEIDPSGEFRCFVKEQNLIGVCQREYSSYLDYIHHQKDSILLDLVSFFKKNIQFRFPSTDYVFDVYRERNNLIHLIDFNPFGGVTDALLFTWSELDQISSHLEFPEFRYVKENLGVQPRPFSYHAMPRDIIDISTGEDSLKLVDLMKLKINEQESSSSEDDGQEN